MHVDRSSFCSLAAAAAPAAVSVDRSPAADQWSCSSCCDSLLPRSLLDRSSCCGGCRVQLLLQLSVAAAAACAAAQLRP
eukprot:10336934-Alexandrium_andersonii.AAC.1